MGPFKAGTELSANLIDRGTGEGDELAASVPSAPFRRAGRVIGIPPRHHADEPLARVSQGFVGARALMPLTKACCCARPQTVSSNGGR